MAPLVRTGGSRHTGLAALPHRNIQQAVGEADWPFGAASGRLVLYEGKSRISKADFELRDDGRNIRSSIWEVTWHEDSVEVILSGDEQFDEQ